MFVDPSVIQLLVPLYNSPDRHYHGLDHIYYSMSKLTEYDKHIKVSDVAFQSLAHSIWFHDAIYSPYPWANGISNENLSTQLFIEYFNPLIIGAQAITGPRKNEDHLKYLNLLEVRGRTVEAILQTEFHNKETHDNLRFPETTLAMLDIDMAGFARPYNVVHKFSEQILKEYAPLGLDRKTMLGYRLKFLEGLLAKKSIYHTEYFKDTHEKIARENITGVIDETQIEIEFVL